MGHELDADTDDGVYEESGSLVGGNSPSLLIPRGHSTSLPNLSSSNGSSRQNPSNLISSLRDILSDINDDNNGVYEESGSLSGSEGTGCEEDSTGYSDSSSSYSDVNENGYRSKLKRQRRLASQGVGGNSPSLLIPRGHSTSLPNFSSSNGLSKDIPSNLISSLGDILSSVNDDIDGNFTISLTKKELSPKKKKSSKEKKKRDAKKKRKSSKHKHKSNPDLDLSSDESDLVFQKKKDDKLSDKKSKRRRQKQKQAREAKTQGNSDIVFSSKYPQAPGESDVIGGNQGTRFSENDILEEKRSLLRHLSLSMKNNSPSAALDSATSAARGIICYACDEATGMCAFHPNVQLRKKMRFGGWKDLLKQCPECVNDVGHHDNTSREAASGPSEELEAAKGPSPVDNRSSHIHIHIGRPRTKSSVRGKRRAASSSKSRSRSNGRSQSRGSSSTPLSNVHSQSSGRAASVSETQARSKYLKPSAEAKSIQEQEPAEPALARRRRAKSMTSTRLAHSNDDGKEKREQSQERTRPNSSVRRHKSHRQVHSSPLSSSFKARVKFMNGDIAKKVHFLSPIVAGSNESDAQTHTDTECAHPAQNTKHRGIRGALNTSLRNSFQTSSVLKSILLKKLDNDKNTQPTNQHRPDHLSQSNAGQGSKQQEKVQLESNCSSTEERKINTSSHSQPFTITVNSESSPLSSTNTNSMGENVHFQRSKSFSVAPSKCGPDEQLRHSSSRGNALEGEGMSPTKVIESVLYGKTSEGGLTDLTDLEHHLKANVSTHRTSKSPRRNSGGVDDSRTSPARSKTIDSSEHNSVRSEGSTPDKSSSSPGQMHTYNLGDKGRRRDMVKEKDKGMAMSRVGFLKPGDHAFVYRNSGQWTYAEVKKVSSDCIVFIVDSKGSSKSYNTRFWSSHIRNKK